MPEAPFPGGRRAAIALTYDDGHACHRTLVAPTLEQRGLRGTFFCPANSADLHAQVEGWRAMAAAGHELGNHTCFHPCRQRDGWTWLDPAYDLRTYNRKRIVDEIRLAQQVLRLVDGRERRAFAATCGDVTSGPDHAQEDFVEDIRPWTSVVRKGWGGIQPLSPPGYTVDTFIGDRRAAAQIIPLLEKLVSEGGWISILFHAVGGGEHNSIAVDEHLRLCDWLAGQSERLWSGTLTEVADRLNAAGT